MPAPVARLFHGRLVAAADRLEEAAGKPDTAAGAVDVLVILEQVLADLRELRALVTAWAIEDGMAEVPIERVAQAVGRGGTTVTRRYGDEQVTRLRRLD
jgi:hypothetical protein